MKSLAIALTTCVLLSACSTVYMDARNPLAISGGYWEKAGPGKLTTVGFSANGYTSSETAAKLLLRRCTELAKAAGKPYFLIYETPVHAVADRPIKDFNVFKLGNKPNPVVYVLMQDTPSAFTFSVEAEQASNHQQEATKP